MGKRWTEEEISRLDWGYGFAYTDEELCARIPGRSIEAIHRKARRLGLKMATPTVLYDSSRDGWPGIPVESVPHWKKFLRRLGRIFTFRERK